VQSATFAAEAEVEESHWWFVGRRRLFGRLIRQMKMTPDAAVIDVGTSTGANLRMLRDEGFLNVQGVDLSPEAQRYCESKGLGHVRLGSILELPYQDDSFDLALATDVIEHVDRDELALAEIQRVLRPGGRAIITVPAFMSLWGPQDVVAEHKCRYRKRQLLDRISRSRLETLDSYYFNYLLFVPILVARKLLRLFRVPIRSENDVNFALMNSVLRAVFGFDTWSAGYLRPPFGVSILAICRKPSSNAPTSS
jgi:ubiquinone/menaquinone biosynthesis C-methylase UbiE